jgi:predicted RNA methylase
MPEILSPYDEVFVIQMRHRIVRGDKDTKLSVEKLASGFGILDKNRVKELTELAIVQQARAIARQPWPVRERYEHIVQLYQNQVNLSHRTSQSILLQQYSTPAPISFLAGMFCLLGTKTSNYKVLEPSAGNGLLTNAFPAKNCTVNEIDDLRNAILRSQGYFFVSQRDATILEPSHRKKFDIVITNPPFGSLEKAVDFEGFPIQSLEHLMCLRALEAMKDNGRAAMIIGGHTSWDSEGRIQAGRNRVFFNYLYSRYFVDDVINIDGHKLYSRQGTAFNTRLILVSGRKASPSGAAPLFNALIDKVVFSFDELYHRVLGQFERSLLPHFVQLFSLKNP